MCSSPLVAVSWPAIFYIFAGMGVLWLGLWMKYAASSPEEHPTITPKERALIIGDSSRDDEGPAAEGTYRPLVVPWGRICREPAFIGAALCHFGHNWANYFALSWLPKYLNEQVLRIAIEMPFYRFLQLFLGPQYGG